MDRLKGRRGIITGAASGIGRASAELFAREGAALVLADVAAGVHAVAEEIAARGGRVRAMIADVAEEDAVAGLVAEAVGQFGGLEILFANAGISGRLRPILGLEAEDWWDVVRVNLLGTFFCLKHAAAHMADHDGGSIVCTASVAGLRAGAGAAHYSASKAAVINLVQLAAIQLRGTGVRVNAVCPGLVETGMTKELFDAARRAGKGDKIGQLNPLERAAEPAEIARAALFLASDEAGYVNGEALVVDGGLSSSHPFIPGKIL